jgi:hypothetical protein
MQRMQDYAATLLADKSSLIFNLTSTFCHDPHFNLCTFPNVVVSLHLWLNTLACFFLLTDQVCHFDQWVQSLFQLSLRRCNNKIRICFPHQLQLLISQRLQHFPGLRPWLFSVRNYVKLQ